MMDYESFKKEVEDRILYFIPRGKENYWVRVSGGQKVNRCLDFISVIPKYRKAGGFVPSTNLQDLYSEYKKCGNIEGLLSAVAGDLMEALRAGADINRRVDIRKIKEQAVLSLIHREQNRELLKNSPHRPWLDLAITYRWIVDMGAGMSSQISHKMAEDAGLDEEALFQAAFRNTRRLLPPIWKGQSELMRELLNTERSAAWPMEAHLPAGKSMYVLMNEDKWYGASGILYSDILHGMAEKLGSDLYLLPSSIHEWIAMPAADDLERLANMVREINFTTVSLEERLSDQVYYYDREKREVRLATNRPFEPFKNING